MVILRAAFLAGSHDREMVWAGLESVPAEEELEEGSELRVGDFDGSAAGFAHEVFVVVVERDMPPSRPPIAQRDVVDEPDPGQIVKDPVDGRRFYAARGLLDVIDDQPCAYERLVTRRQGTKHGPSRKGEAESGFAEPL